VELDPLRAQRAVSTGRSARERLKSQVLADAEREMAAVT
jgi:hypothetical protein